MNYLTTVIGLIFVSIGTAKISSSDAPTSDLLDKEWDTFTKKYRKVYWITDKLEQAAFDRDKRKFNFAVNRHRRDRFNNERSAKEGFRLDLNEHADLSDADLTSRLGYRARHPFREEPHEFHKLVKSTLNSTSVVPDEFDWRQISDRTSALNSRKEHSCIWSAIMIGAIEGEAEAARSKRVPTTLHCSNPDYGCSAGLMRDVHAYAQDRVKGGEVECVFMNDKLKIQFRYSNEFPWYVPSQEEKLKKFVALFGPVASIITYPEGGAQRTGTFYGNDCIVPSLKEAHVLIVGYGTHPKEGDYWIVKDCGKPWGYFKVSRNSGNNCDIIRNTYIYLW